jgi:hypothetical protein
MGLLPSPALGEPVLPRPLLQKLLGSVNYFTLGRAKTCEPLRASSMRRRGDSNARVDNRRRGRDWPNLVGRRDVELGPRGRLGFGRDIAASSVARHWLTPSSREALTACAKAKEAVASAVSFLLPSPAFSKGSHRSLARLSIAVGRRTVLVVPERPASTPTAIRPALHWL